MGYFFWFLSARGGIPLHRHFIFTFGSRWRVFAGPVSRTAADKFSSFFFKAHDTILLSVHTAILFGGYQIIVRFDS
jgi:hypothetical protein